MTKKDQEIGDNVKREHTKRLQYHAVVGMPRKLVLFEVSVDAFLQIRNEFGVFLVVKPDSGLHFLRIGCKYSAFFLL
jgi:hypothetical protein